MKLIGEELLQNEIPFRKKQINRKKFTGMKYKEILFNSDKQHWEINKSEFNKVIIGKKNIALFIQRTVNEKEQSFIFGGFVFNEINKQTTIDPNAFLFTFMNNNTIKIPLNESKIQLFEEKEIKLITFGNNDVVISKKGKFSFCQSNNDQCHYDYPNDKALCGRSGFKEDGRFTVEKVVVLQFN